MENSLGRSVKAFIIIKIPPPANKDPSNTRKSPKAFESVPENSLAVYLL
jgi:hypothetical protein